MTPDPTATAAPVADEFSVLSQAVIPATAILVSVGLAVLLFFLERRSAERARQQERQDKLLEELIATLAFFVSVNPLVETWATEFRKLRAQAVILQALPSASARLLGDWLASEGRRGMRLLSSSMETLQSASQVTEDQLLSVMQPAHSWADDCINTIALWMRGDISDDQVRALIEELKTESAKSPPVGH
jgi:hypothetical protein